MQRQIAHTLRLTSTPNPGQTLDLRLPMLLPSDTYADTTPCIGRTREIQVLRKGEAEIRSVLLLLWITVVWVLWALAATLQTRLTDARDPLPNGQQRGMSVLPVIPLFPAALWGIALLIDRFVDPWGSSCMAVLHGCFALLLAGSISLDFVRLRAIRRKSP